MTEVNALLSGIEGKIKKLVITQKAIKEKNIQLIEEKNELLNKIEEQQKLIKNLEIEKEQNLLQNSESKELSENKIQVSSKIGELVQEIDKCIEYLKS